MADPIHLPTDPDDLAAATASAMWARDRTAQALGMKVVAIRAGHVCCQPLMKHLGHPAINRASYHFYNTTDETTRLIEALRTTRKIFGPS